MCRGGGVFQVGEREDARLQALHMLQLWCGDTNTLEVNRRTNDLWHG